MYTLQEYCKDHANGSTSKDFIDECNHEVEKGHSNIKNKTCTVKDVGVC